MSQTGTTAKKRTKRILENRKEMGVAKGPRKRK
jgi:hypothetical protein